VPSIELSEVKTHWRRRAMRLVRCAAKRSAPQWRNRGSPKIPRTGLGRRGSGQADRTMFIPPCSTSLPKAPARMSQTACVSPSFGRFGRLMCARPALTEALLSQLMGP
jgi:hypothetical protein